jgi:hypothetical protein
VLDRVLAQGDVYLHHVCNEDRDYGHARFTDSDDILVRSEDGGRTYTVAGFEYTSRAAAAAGGGARRLLKTEDEAAGAAGVGDPPAETGWLAGGPSRGFGKTRAPLAAAEDDGGWGEL